MNTKLPPTRNELADQCNALTARVAELEAALCDIEMETRDGGQWGLSDINEYVQHVLAKGQA